MGFYVNLNEKDNNEVLIKEDHTSEKDQALYQNHDKSNKSSTSTEKPEQGLGLLIGQDISSLISELGEPQRIDESLYGYQWYIYNIDYSRYVQVGVKENEVVTVYAIGEELDISPFKIGQPVEEIYNSQYISTNLDIELNGNTYRFELDDMDFNIRPLVLLGDVFVQLYIDKFTGKLSSVRFLNKEILIKQRPYELIYRGELIEPEDPNELVWQKIEESAAREIFDITNVLRIRHNLQPLLWDEQTASVAFGHSKDMAENNDFSHTSKTHGDLSDRLKAAEVLYQSAGENIAANYTDGPAAVEGWLNSKGHREALLNKEFSHLGVGVYQKHYTQNFIQKFEE
nr:CAP domain-containing protein [Bacillus sp. MRMR6]